MKLGPVFLSTALLVIAAAPVFAGGLTADTPGTGGGSPAPCLTVEVMNAAGAHVIGANGALWTIPQQVGEQPVQVGIAVTGDTGKMSFLVAGHAKGEALSLVIVADGYVENSMLVFLSRGTQTFTTTDLVPMAGEPRGGGGTPQGAPTAGTTSWGAIKALY